MSAVIAYLLSRLFGGACAKKMGKFKQVIVLEVECAKDKNAETEGGKYRRDTPWLVESFKKKGVESKIVFITNKDNAETLQRDYPDTAFLGRVNPMDYPILSLDEYVKILEDLHKVGKLFGPIAEHMDRLGSKMILFELRDSTMGYPGILLHAYADLQKNTTEMDRILPRGGPSRVLKMMRGSTGLGVWKLENKDASGDTILWTDAYTQKTDEVKRGDVLGKFCELSNEDAISMPFLPLIKEGEFRFLMSKDKILEIVHKKPIDESAFTATLRSGAVYKIFDLKEHKAMVATVEEWSRSLKKICGLDDIPYWWSVDCIEADGCPPGCIPSSNAGRRLILSEINCSCLGLVADTSAEAKLKGMRFADMIAEICLG